MQIVQLLYPYYARQGKKTIEIVDEMLQREFKSCLQCIISYNGAKARTIDASGPDFFVYICACLMLH